MVSLTSDPRGRIISIFVGAVLLPSIALSFLSFQSVPKVSESTALAMVRQADKALYWVERDLETKARAHALSAARAIGPEALVDGREEVVRKAMAKAGLPEDMFDTLRLEGASPSKVVAALSGAEDDLHVLREALRGFEAAPGPEDSVPLGVSDEHEAGVLRFSFACGYAHRTLLKEYFEKDFDNPDQSFVVRVTEPPDWETIYETAPTPDGHFETKREMHTPSFKGLKLQVRYKERSIKDVVHRLAMVKTALILLIDLMLGAGLYLVYANVKRELHLSRLKSDFVANVSHELKTPLALIRLFAETLELGRVPGEDKAKQYYRIINKESHRLTQLINNILDFSRIEAGRKEYRFARTDVARIIHDVLESYRFPIEQQGFALETDIADDLPPADVDKEAVSQALINLVNNAIKYSPAEKYLKVTARAEDGAVAVAVTDRGMGIAKADHKRIFEKFYRAENSLVHETKGSGLGLSLVQHIAEAHGGSVKVESAPGKGSTFTLLLPLARREEVKAPNLARVTST
ncbi:MAG TPA: HAMP domain-containing sensor histidine kinase [Vicinamibacteria bacterium]